MTTTHGHLHKEETTTHSHMHDVTTTDTHTEVTHGVHMEETTTHPVFQPYRIQMSTVVVASHSPLVAGKEILNKHTIKSSSALNEDTVESSSLGFFNSILYTSTEPHSAADDR